MNKIKQARKSKGYTQQFVADKVGISKRHYQYIEKGDRVGTFKVLKSICKLLNINMNDLEG